MTDETLNESLSTLITESTAIGTGGGTPPPDQAQAEDQADDKISIADVIRKEAKAQDAAAKEEKKAEKAEPAPEDKAEAKSGEQKTEVKAEAAAKEKEVAAEKPDEAGEGETAKAAQSEGKADRIPSRLLPKEREVWANVPNAVKAAWQRMETEHSEVAQKYEAAAKFHEELREYDEMAKAANTNIKTALDRYVAMDKRIAANFGEGVAEIARSFGKNPTEAVAQFMRAAGVTPQQLGAYLQGQPAQPAQAQAQAQPKVDPVAARALQEVAQLKQMLQTQKVEQRQSQIVNEVVTPFASSHPRFAELQDDIAMFLNSGKIPTSLSPVERLEVAYDMAERINPAPVSTSPNFAEPAGNPPASDAGKKSVRGAPASGQSKDADFDDETDLVALLRKEARKMTA